MAKISVRRKTPLKQDEVLTLAQRLFRLAKVHRKPLILAGMCLALILGGTGIFKYWQKSRRDAAAAALAEVRPKLDGQALTQEALKDLDKIVSRYRSLPAGREAALYRAHLLYQLSKYEEAAKAYEDLLADPAIRKEPGLVALVTESLSYCYEGLGNYAEAEKCFNLWWTAPPGPFKSTWCAGWRGFTTGPENPRKQGNTGKSCWRGRRLRPWCPI